MAITGVYMQWAKSLFLWLTAPLRYLIRREVRLLQRHLDRKIPDVNDIQDIVQSIARNRTGQYVYESMPFAVPLSSQTEVLDYALNRAEISSASVICEFGVFEGHTINHIAKSYPCRVFGFDSFDGLPEDWRQGFEAGTFAVTALPDVPANVILKKGLFKDTLPCFVRKNDRNIPFIHIDCDLYSSTRDIFTLLGEQIQPGCVIVFDEYFNYPGWENGEYLAFQEFILSTGLSYEYLCYNRFHEQVAIKILN